MTVFFVYNLIMNFHIVKVAYAASATWTGECVSGDVATIQGIGCLVGNLLGFFPYLIVFVAVGIIITSGVKIMTAPAGDAKTLSAAWSAITWSVIGIILMSIIWFAIILIEKFTGANLTEFKVGI